MKPMYLVGVVVVVATLAYFFWPFSKHTSITNYPSSGTDIIAYGDSLVAGYGSTDNQGFVSILSQSIGQPIINLGKDGDTTAEALARLPEFDKYHPKVVILLVGGNDYMQRKNMDTAFQNIASIIDDLQKRGAVVVLVGARLNVVVGNFDKQYQALVSKYHVAYVPDVYDGVLGNPKYMFDGVHPNDAGYAIFAERILPTLNSVLK
jgi:acyl-CoA thioesterase-1